jgi:hypothetical protein
VPTALTIPEGFTAEEFVPPEVFELLGDLSVRIFEPAVFEVLAQLRADFGPLIVNNWHRKGQFRYRGFRPLTYTSGAPKSQHRLASALDCHSPTIPVPELRAKVIAKARANEGAYAKIGAIEDGVNWLHFDVRPRVNGQLLVFKP